MDWHDVTGRFHQRTFADECRLSSLPAEWQRELAALWRLEADVNNGGYLQFFVNWGRESYVYASQALKKTGAHTVAAIIDACQALVDEHFDSVGKTPKQRQLLAPNTVLDCRGEVQKGAGSVLPNSVVARLYELSDDFMDYPDDIAELGWKYYRNYLADCL